MSEFVEQQVTDLFKKESEQSEPEPLVQKDNKNVMISLRLTNDVMETLKVRSKMEGMSVSNWIRKAIEEAITKEAMSVVLQRDAFIKLLKDEEVQGLLKGNITPQM